MVIIVGTIQWKQIPWERTTKNNVIIWDFLDILTNITDKFWFSINGNN